MLRGWNEEVLTLDHRGRCRDRLAGQAGRADDRRAYEIGNSRPGIAG
jgi:hypothetical protein